MLIISCPMQERCIISTMHFVPWFLKGQLPAGSGGVNYGVCINQEAKVAANYQDGRAGSAGFPGFNPLALPGAFSGASKTQFGTRSVTSHPSHLAVLQSTGSAGRTLYCQDQTT